MGSERWCPSRYLQVFHHTVQCFYRDLFAQANVGLVHRLGGSHRGCRQGLQLPAELVPFTAPTAEGSAPLEVAARPSVSGWHGSAVGCHGAVKDVENKNRIWPIMSCQC